MTAFLFNREWHQGCVLLQNDGNANRPFISFHSEMFSFIQSITLKDDTWCKGIEETWGLFLSLSQSFCTTQEGYMLKFSTTTYHAIYGPPCCFQNWSRVFQDLKLNLYFKDIQGFSSACLIFPIWKWEMLLFQRQ